MKRIPYSWPYHDLRAFAMRARSLTVGKAWDSMLVLKHDYDSDVLSFHLKDKWKEKSLYADFRFEVHPGERIVINLAPAETLYHVAPANRLINTLLRLQLGRLRKTTTSQPGYRVGYAWCGIGGVQFSGPITLRREFDGNNLLRVTAESYTPISPTTTERTRYKDMVKAYQMLRDAVRTREKLGVDLRAYAIDLAIGGEETQVAHEVIAMAVSNDYPLVALGRVLSLMASSGSMPTVIDDGKVWAGRTYWLRGVYEPRYSSAQSIVESWWAKHRVEILDYCGALVPTAAPTTITTPVVLYDLRAKPQPEKRIRDDQSLELLAAG